MFRDNIQGQMVTWFKNLTTKIYILRYIHGRSNFFNKKHEFMCTCKPWMFIASIKLFLYNFD